MTKKISWLVVSCLMVVSLVLASCAVAPTPSPNPTPIPVPTPTPTPTTTPTPTPASGAPQYGGMITLTTKTFTNFEPYRRQNESLEITSYIYEKIAIGNPTIDRNEFGFTTSQGTPLRYLKPNLAESWEMPDLLTVIVHLKKGIRFQDIPPVNGREITADDVAWNYNRYIADPFIARTVFDLVDSAKATDKYTVEIKLKPPAVVDTLRPLIDETNSLFVAKECLGAKGEIDDWRKMVGTGPYMIQDFVSDSAVTLKKNPNYWAYDERYPQNRLPYADNIKYLIITDYSTWLSALRSGKIDRQYSVLWQDAASLKKTNPELRIKECAAEYGYIYRMRYDKAPFTDVRVRQAINMSVDRETIVKSFYGGSAYPYTGEISRGNAEWTPYEKLPDKPKWTTVSVKEVLSYNPEKAKKLLAEAGYPNGFKTNITNCPTSPYTAPGLTALFQSYLKAIGIDAEIKNYERATFDTVRYGKQHDQMIMSWNGMAAPLDSMLSRVYDPTHIYNTGVIYDPVFQKMYDIARKTFDDATRIPLVTELNMYCLETGTLVSLPWTNVSYVWQPWLGGYAGEVSLGASGQGALFARCWIDNKLKKSMGY